MALLTFFLGAAICYLLVYLYWQKKIQAANESQRVVERELALTRSDFENLQAKHKSTTNQLAKAKEDLEAKGNDLKASEEKVATAEEEASGLTEKLTAAEKTVKESTDKLAALEKQVEELSEVKQQLEENQTQLNAKTEELDGVSEKLAALEAEIESQRATGQTLEAAAAGEADDLGKIEGIGPKIAAVLSAQGIASFAQLAEAKLDQIKEILKAAGSGFAMADPQTWSQQAELATAGQWEELQALQDKLDGGKETE